MPDASGTTIVGPAANPREHGVILKPFGIVRHSAYAAKPANNAEPSAAEPGEPRTGTKGNADQQSTRQAQDWESVSQAMARIRQAAKIRKKERFTSLLHHVSVDLLRLSFFELKKDAAPGVDGLAWRDYETNLEVNLEDLHDRVHRGAYRALPSRRQYIPKADGRQRPIAICALEDKIVQRAVTVVLNAIYEGASQSWCSPTGERPVREALARYPAASVA